MGTALVAGILLVIIGTVLLSMCREKKQGRSACGGNCAHCSGCRH